MCVAIGGVDSYDFHALETLHRSGAGHLTAVCVLAAPEGIERVRGSGLADAVCVAAIDDSLDDNGFILPGLGDAGDRQFNPVVNPGWSSRPGSGDAR